jgi:hypothetical protein
VLLVGDSTIEVIVVKTNETQDEAQSILDAIQTIENSPELKSEAQTNPGSAMDRLGLTGIARHAVAFAITAAVAAPLAHSANIVGFNGVWH